MVSELVATVAVLAAVAGAAFSVWWNTDDKVPVSHSKLIKSIVGSAFIALGLVNITNLPDLGSVGFSWIGLIITEAFVGAGVTKAFNHS